MNLEEDMSTPSEQSPFHGMGTSDSPFRPAASEENIHAIAALAKETNEPKYCSFEGSIFRIHPDGKVEWARRMPELRDNIADIIEESLSKWREKLSND